MNYDELSIYEINLYGKQYNIQESNAINETLERALKVLIFHFPFL